MCVYCYASSYIPRFNDCRPKKNLIPRLRKEAAKLKGETISMSNSSDPYPNLEIETSLTRKCLEIITEQSCKVQIITKSNHVVRDIDLLRKVPSTVSITITTDDDTVGMLVEPKAPLPSERLEAVETLVGKGIPTCIRIDPIIPFVNDKPESLMETIAAMGVKHVTSSTLKIKPSTWPRISTKLPNIAERLKPLYFKRGEKMGGYIFLPKDIRFELMATIGLLAKKHKLRFGTCREGLSCLNTASCDGSWLLNGRLGL